MRSKRGFTLIELVVVIAIIGFLLEALFPTNQVAWSASRPNAFTSDELPESSPNLETQSLKGGKSNKTNGRFETVAFYQFADFFNHLNPVKGSLASSKLLLSHLNAGSIVGIAPEFRRVAILSASEGSPIELIGTCPVKRALAMLFGLTGGNSKLPNPASINIRSGGSNKVPELASKQSNKADQRFGDEESMNHGSSIESTPVYAPVLLAISAAIFGPVIILIARSTIKTKSEGAKVKSTMDWTEETLRISRIHEGKLSEDDKRLPPTEKLINFCVSVLHGPNKISSQNCSWVERTIMRMQIDADIFETAIEEYEIMTFEEFHVADITDDDDAQDFPEKEE